MSRRWTSHLHWLAILVLLAPAPALSSDAISCVQTYLTRAGYGLGASDGQLGKKTLAAAEHFAKYYTALGLPQLADASSDQWCAALSSTAGQAILESRVVPAMTAPKETIARQGGLNFASSLVRENYSDTRKLWHDFEASTWPGRVAVEVDPGRVHSGKSSIRMHVLKGDCGWTTHRDGGQWNDCEHANERVETNAEPHKAGEYYYALSVMFSDNITVFGPYPNPWAHNEINLYQWFQYDVGACFDLLYNIKVKALDVSVFCSEGKFDGQYKRVILADSRPNVWHEFIIHAKWSFKDDGFFRVLQNGKMVMNYVGKTMSPEGRPLLVEHPQVYLYGESLNPRGTSWEHFDTPVTVWFDDMIRASSLTPIQKKYRFDPRELTNFEAAIPMTDLHP